MISLGIHVPNMELWELMFTILDFSGFLTVLSLL